MSRRPYKPSNRKALHTWVDRELFLQVKAIADYAGLNLSTVVHDALALWLVKERTAGKSARDAPQLPADVAARAP